jgi:hypothetical protein
MPSAVSGVPFIDTVIGRPAGKLKVSPADGYASWNRPADSVTGNVWPAGVNARDSLVDHVNSDGQSWLATTDTGHITLAYGNPFVATLAAWSSGPAFDTIM